MSGTTKKVEEIEQEEKTNTLYPQQDLFNFVRRRGPWAAKAREASLPAPTVAGNPEADGTASGEGDDVVVASGGVEEKVRKGTHTYMACSTGT